MSSPAFLIRTKQNRIYGPLTKEDLANRVMKGELDTLDEICPASGFWIYLHERAEVKRVLGVDPPLKMKSKDPNDPDTETETETATVPVTAIVTTGSATASPMETTLRNETPGAGRAPEFHTAQISAENYSVERPSLLKFLLYALVAFMVFILVRIYQLTQI